MKFQEKQTTNNIWSSVSKQRAPARKQAQNKWNRKARAMHSADSWLAACLVKKYERVGKPGVNVNYSTVQAFNRQAASIAHPHKTAESLNFNKITNHT